MHARRATRLPRQCRHLILESRTRSMRLARSLQPEFLGQHVMRSVSLCQAICASTLGWCGSSARTVSDRPMDTHTDQWTHTGISLSFRPLRGKDREHPTRAGFLHCHGPDPGGGDTELPVAGAEGPAWRNFAPGPTELAWPLQRRCPQAPAVAQLEVAKKGPARGPWLPVPRPEPHIGHLGGPGLSRSLTPPAA